MADIAGLLGMLPQLVAVSQYVFIIFSVLFFGSIAVRGAPVEWYLRWVLRVGLGAVALAAAYGLSAFVPDVLPFMRLLNIDVLVTGVAASLVLAAGLYLITRTMDTTARIEEKIRKLEKQKQKGSGLRTPSAIAGVVLIVVVIVLAALTFKGITNPTADLLDTLPGLENGTAGLDVMKYCTVDGDTLDCRIPLTAVPGLTDKA